MAAESPSSCTSSGTSLGQASVGKFEEVQGRQIGLHQSNLKQPCHRQTISLATTSVKSVLHALRIL